MSPSPTPTTRKLSTADERREQLLRAAEEVFAERGIHGTPTAAVAKAAGLSHAYLFRLFPTKSDLALALVERCHDRIVAAFQQAADRAKADGEDVFQAMGAAYIELLEDRQFLLLMLHSYAAAPSMPEIQQATRRCFKRLVELAQRESQAPPDEIQRFFAQGMLINILGAMNAPAVDEPWARLLMGEDC